MTIQTLAGGGVEVVATIESRREAPPLKMVRQLDYLGAQQKIRVQFDILTERHSFTVFADYHQFYVWDAGVNPLAPEDYTDDDVRRMVKVAPHVVVVQPVRNMEVPVELEVHDADPGFELSEWDHIAECSLALPTGRLQVDECTGRPVLDLRVTPGTYCVRVLFAGLDTLSEDGLEGEDRYRVDLWPGALRELAIVKQWIEGPG